MLVKPPVRGQDKHGDGAYGASRGGRKHNGVDLAITPGSIILSCSFGVVTKIGYPYDQSHDTRPDTISLKDWDKYLAKKAMRYVQVTDTDGIDRRYFYITPMVKKGQTVKEGDELGVLQKSPYKGITEHCHFEVKQGAKYLNPHGYL